MSSKTNGYKAVQENGKNHGDYEEVKIPVPWGHISGKWWGPKDLQPILAIHGWQDNAGSFDPLAPILVSEGFSLLCIDLPGHGHSSPYPQGLYYYIFWDGVPITRRIARHFGWKKLTILGHSLGGAIGFLYAATYPEDVEKYISLDIASPSVRDPDAMVSVCGESVDRFLKFENLKPEHQPCYIYEEMLDIVRDGYKGAVTDEGCEILMRRGTRPAEHKEGCHVFTRDPRLKVAALGFMTMDQVLAFATKIKCEVLNIRAVPGMAFDKPEYYDKVLDEIEKNAKKIVRTTVEGTHHVHLNDADKVAPPIIDFLRV